MSTGLFSRATRRLRKEVETLKSWIYRALLSMSCWWHGGVLVAGPRLRAQHRTIFQGDGCLRIGADVTLGYTLAGFPCMPIVLQPRNAGAEIVIGDGTYLMNGSLFVACEAIHVGADCRIGGNCIVLDSDFHGLRPSERNTVGKTAPVTIGDNVWLGVSVTVLKGVRIGNDAVVGAQTVIAKDVPAGAIAVGNPMRIIGSVYDLPPDDQIRARTDA